MSKYLKKNILLPLAFLGVAPLGAWAQEAEDPGGFDLATGIEQHSAIVGKFGLAAIDGTPYLGMRLQPDIAIGKLGFGLDVPVFFSVPDFDFRYDEYVGGVGVLRLARYVRWGVKKKDPIYLRLGTLDNAQLGHGLLVNNYSNVTSIEKRKTGLEGDLLFKKTLGFEFIYSDLNFHSLNMLAMRPYARPLGFTGIPIVKTLEVGASFVTDHDNTAIRVNDSLTVSTSQLIDDGMNALGLDLGLWLVNTRFMRLSAAAQYGQILKNDQVETLLHSLAALGAPDSAHYMGYAAGNGVSLGLNANMNLVANVFRLDARLERIWFGDYFVPQFFDVNYEIDKDGKSLALGAATQRWGTYGSLTANLIGKIFFTGSLLIPDRFDAGNPAFLRLDMDASNIIENVEIRGTYTKGGIAEPTLDEFFGLDQRSLATVRAAYRFARWFVTGVDFHWTFAQTEEGGFDATHYWMPYVGFSIPFGQTQEEEPIMPTDDVQYR